MNLESQFAPIRLAHEPKDRAAISAALAQLENNSRAQSRQLAIIGPECEGIRNDEGNRSGSVEMVIDEFLRKPANRKSQFGIALSALGELQREVAEIVPVLIEDASAMEADIHSTFRVMIEQGRAKVEMHLQVWFSGANLPLAITRTELILSANSMVSRYNPQAWGYSLSNFANEPSLTNGRNSAAEIVRLYSAQVNSFMRAREEIQAFAAHFGKL